MPSKNKDNQKTPNFRDRQRFPESGNAMRQLKLLLMGLMPAIRQKVYGRLYGLCAAKDGCMRFLQKLTAPKLAHHFVFVAASLVIAVFAVFEALYTEATTVTFNGVELATVASVEEAEAACLSVERSLSDALGYEFTLEDNVVSYSTGLTYRSAVVDEQTLEEAISGNLQVVEHGYALYIDGEFIGATQTEGAFEQLLEQATAAYRNEHTVSIDFVEEVEIRECQLPVEEFTNLADAALLLNSTKAGEVTYTVEAGDCWSVIAENHGMTNQELLDLNPGYDIDKLQIGDVLLISTAVPYLTVVVTQMEYYVADVPYSVDYVDDSTMWKGDTRIISKGVYGTADTVACVTYRGAEEIKREVVSEVILTEAINEVQARGIVERPSWAPTGTFRWPTNGKITSYYGYRNIFGSRSFHGGIDIANSRGTDIVAADGGQVIYAGWMSGYGYLIKIDHLNGYVTYYGHNSKMLVKVGDYVHKGEHIAEMGSTGRSTGPHLHFEVRYNGERQNPMNYLQ